MPDRKSRDRPTRSAPWPNSAIRRVAAALCAAFAVWFGLDALTEHDSLQGSPVLVAVNDLAAGVVIRAQDVSVQNRPIDQQPGGAIADAEEAIGATTSHPLKTGEIVLDLDLSFGGWLGEGEVAMPVPVADELTLSAATPGQRVDVWVSGRPDPVATDALVLGQSGSVGDPALLLALTSAQAQRIAESGGDGTPSRVAVRAQVSRD